MAGLKRASWGPNSSHKNSLVWQKILARALKGEQSAGTPQSAEDSHALGMYNPCWGSPAASKWTVGCHLRPLYTHPKIQKPTPKGESCGHTSVYGNWKVLVLGCIHCEASRCHRLGVDIKKLFRRPEGRRSSKEHLFLQRSRFGPSTHMAAHTVSNSSARKSDALC